MRLSSGRWSAMAATARRANTAPSNMQTRRRMEVRWAAFEVEKASSTALQQGGAAVWVQGG